MKPRPPTRTIKRAIDLSSLTALTSDQLLEISADAYNLDVRRPATVARNNGQARFVCEQCQHPVYAPRDVNGRPYWKHLAGAPHACPWWTGDPSSVDEASASQFNGAQEGPLHKRVKDVIATLLEGDGGTEAGSVVIDQYLVADGARRRPDVRAIYDGRPIAFELQLANTQIPIIVGREDFYSENGFRLLWLTWNLDPTARERLPSTFEDIFYSHNKNLFSLDEDVVRMCRERNEFLLRVFWQVEAAWQSKIVRLANLQWLDNGRAHAVAPAQPWQTDFLARWLAATDERGTAYPENQRLLAELANRVTLDDPTGERLRAEDAESVINCLLSLRDGRPVGTAQSNLRELLNTFFAAPSRHRYARLVDKFARLVGQEGLLGVPSIANKMEAAKRTAPAQAGQRSNVGCVALALFPNVFHRPPLRPA
jgi:hypothetical protein